jgi:hypothetical protein
MRFNIEAKPTADPCGGSPAAKINIGNYPLTVHISSQIIQGHGEKH